MSTSKRKRSITKQKDDEEEVEFVKMVKSKLPIWQELKNNYNPRADLSTSSANTLNAEEDLDNFVINKVMFNLLEASDRQDVFILPPEFTYFLNKKSKELSDEELQINFKVDELNDGQIKFVCMPINVPFNNPNHWILLIINIAENKINYYDSLGNNRDTRDPVIELILRNWILKIQWPDDEAQWAIVSPEERLYKQLDSFNCGVWVLRTFQVFLNNGQLSEITNDSVKVYREYLNRVYNKNYDKAQVITFIKPVTSTQIDTVPAYYARLSKFKNNMTGFRNKKQLALGLSKQLTDYGYESKINQMELQDYMRLRDEMYKNIELLKREWLIVNTFFDLNDKEKYRSEKEEWLADFNMSSLYKPLTDNDLISVQRGIEQIIKSYESFENQETALKTLLQVKHESLIKPKVVVSIQKLNTIKPSTIGPIETRYLTIDNYINQLDQWLGITNRNITEFLPVENAFVNVFQSVYALRQKGKVVDNNTIVRIRRNKLDTANRNDELLHIPSLAVALASNDVYRLLTLADYEIRDHYDFNTKNKHYWDITTINPSEALIIAVHYNSFYCVLGLIKLFKDGKLIEPLDLFYYDAKALKVAAIYGCYECILVMLKPFNWKIELILKKSLPPKERSSWYHSKKKFFEEYKLTNTPLTLQQVEAVLGSLEIRNTVNQEDVYRKKLLQDCIKLLENVKKRLSKIY